MQGAGSRTIMRWGSIHWTTSYRLSALRGGAFAGRVRATAPRHSMPRHVRSSPCGAVLGPHSASAHPAGLQRTFRGTLRGWMTFGRDAAFRGRTCGHCRHCGHRRTTNCTTATNSRNSSRLPPRASRVHVPRRQRLARRGAQY